VSCYSADTGAVSLLDSALGMSGEFEYLGSY